MLSRSSAVSGLILFCGLASYGALGQKYGETELVYQWTSLILDWPTYTDWLEATRNGSLVPERNMIAGIKVYNNEVYLTIPRWKWTSGIPATLVKVVIVDGRVKLRPYPTWAAQEQGNCQALQFVQSMEINPNTGFMYVIDTGRIGMSGPNAVSLCPPKIVVYDLNIDREVQRFIMPPDIVSYDSNYMNDIILDYVDGEVKYAYISDPSQALMHVYNFETRQGHNVDDPSMKPGTGNDTIITINDVEYNFPGGLNGIAMSPGFDYVYYCPIGSYNLYQVPTADLRQNNTGGNTANIRFLGKKVSQSGGLIHGSKQLYYGALSLNGVYYWDSKADSQEQNLGIDKVAMKTQKKLVTNDTTMQWPDTFAMDEQGWLWFVSNRLPIFFHGDMDFSVGGGINMRIWKVFVNETSYLSGAF